MSDQARGNGISKVGLDPWADASFDPVTSSLPKGALFLLKLSWRIEIFDGEETYFLHRPDESSAELIAECVTSYPYSRAVNRVARVRLGYPDDHRLGRDLLYEFWAQRADGTTPDSVLEEGALKQADWDAIETELLKTLGRVDWEQIPDPSGIVQLAHELGLHPTGKGTESPRCFANCASGRYCSIGGGPAELREAVDARRS
jgi:hypothetical protein